MLISSAVAINDKLYPSFKRIKWLREHCFHQTEAFLNWLLHSWNLEIDRVFDKVRGGTLVRLLKDDVLNPNISKDAKEKEKGNKG